MAQVQTTERQLPGPIDTAIRAVLLTCSVAREPRLWDAVAPTGAADPIMGWWLPASPMAPGASDDVIVAVLQHGATYSWLKGILALAASESAGWLRAMALASALLCQDDALCQAAGDDVVLLLRAIAARASGHAPTRTASGSRGHGAQTEAVLAA